jgi:hypothetical protein
VSGCSRVIQVWTGLQHFFIVLRSNNASEGDDGFIISIMPEDREVNMIVLGEGKGIITA